MIEDINTQANAINMLTRSLFVVHFWQNLSIIGTDGAMFHLDTRALDVDGDNINKETQRSGGVGFIKRLRLVPVTATQRAVINNREGFSVSNMFVGSLGANGHPIGIGSNMSGATKTNVKGEWHSAEEKISDMMYTFGKYGLIAIRSMQAYDAESHARCQKVFKTVMSGITDRTLLEDMPEYFGDESPYLFDKKRARFDGTAASRVEAAYINGIEINGEMIKLTDNEYQMAERLLIELPPSVMQSHVMALDPESNGILAQTREGLQSGQKRSYDKCDQWLMGQFPSFPMDTTLEKANKQLIKALDNGPEQQQTVQTPEGFVPIAEVYRMQELFEQRLAAIEDRATAETGAATSEPNPIQTAV